MQTRANAEISAPDYQFERGYPVPGNAQNAYSAAIFKGNAKLGVVPNKVFGTLDTQPKHVGFTLNSDTPYAPLLLDLSDGPMVVELPRGRSNKMLVGIRSLPVNGDVPAAIERIKTVKVHPLKRIAGWPETKWLDLTPPPQDTTPLGWENNIRFWRELHEVIDAEVPNPRFHNMYGELAALGIEKARPFTPDARMTGILEKAARTANAQMRVESFGDRRPERIVWAGRQWEWAAGSLYWLGARDSSGSPLDGGKAYKLIVPQPVPGKLFWSVTVYDTQTRSQIQTDQGKAALRSLFELKNVSTSAPTGLYFGPSAPSGHEGQWIKTKMPPSTEPGSQAISKR